VGIERRSGESVEQGPSRPVSSDNFSLLAIANQPGPVFNLSDSVLLAGVGTVGGGVAGLAKIGYNKFLLDVGKEEGWLLAGRLRENVLQNRAPDWFKRGWTGSGAAKATADALQDYQKVKALEVPILKADAEVSQALKGVAKHYTARDFIVNQSTRTYAEQKIAERLPLGQAAIGQTEFAVLSTAKDALERQAGLAANKAVTERMRTSIFNRLDDPVWASSKSTIGRSVLQGLGVAGANLAVDYAGMHLASAYGYERDSAVYKFFQPNPLEVALSVGGSFVGRTPATRVAFAVGGWAIGKSLNYL
jgi:hypothetical protein